MKYQKEATLDPEGHIFIRVYPVISYVKLTTLFIISKVDLSVDSVSFKVLYRSKI